MTNGSDFSDATALALLNGHCDTPFGCLGIHPSDKGFALRVFQPGAARLTAIFKESSVALTEHAPGTGLFSATIREAAPYILQACSEDGAEWTFEDPYRFGPVIGAIDEHLFSEGTHQRLWHILGARCITHEGCQGTAFAVWAPNAHRVSVVGPFNHWDGRCHVMRRRGATGLWEIFLPGLGEGTHYKYEIVGPDGQTLPLKADPVGFGAQHPPETASIVRDITGYGWKDGAWMQGRGLHNDRAAPISIYEVHLPSWKRVIEEDGRALSYKEAAVALVGYVRDMGFTHIEFLPLSEHPFDGSWGYQPVGLFAPSVRHGPPHEFRDLIEAAHAADIGVILDWVPAHFPTDAHGLAQFDGTALYEHADPREGFHHDWNTLIYNFGRREVANFLISNALYWLEEYHVDGLRVDAVASMLYRDYSRAEGEWIPNAHGGRENLEAQALLERMNTLAYGSQHGILTIAEESTAYPGVSAPVEAGGLGFGFKWNMGWMNDTLAYMARDPIHRKHHHDQLTFGFHYAFSENFVLPISHDEVVHGKGSLLGKMPGSRADKFANLRAYLGFMWGHPGKKLLFMGQEFAQPNEWNHNTSLPWDVLNDPAHAGVQRLVKDLNHLYRTVPALHCKDCVPEGFEWIDGSDADRSIVAWLRKGSAGDAPVAVICNFTPIPREAVVVGLPQTGTWHEIFNSDAEVYGGAGVGNLGAVEAHGPGAHGQAQSARVTLPALSTVMLCPSRPSD